VLIVGRYVADVFHDSDNFEVCGILDLARSEMLPDRVLALKEFLRERLVDDSYPSRGIRVLVRNRAAEDDFGTDGLEKARHYSRPSSACILFSGRLRPPFHANTVVPAVSSHWCVEGWRHHAYSGNLMQALIDLAKQRFHLFRLVVAQNRIDPGNVPALSFESKILVLQVAQALGQHG